MEIQTVKLQENGYLINSTITVLNGYSGWIKESLDEWLANNTPEPEFTEAELTAKEINEKISYARQYLVETDWVEAYKIRHDLGLELIPEGSSKWIIIKNRAECKQFLKGVDE